MRIVGPIQIWRGSMIYLFFLVFLGFCFDFFFLRVVQFFLGGGVGLGNNFGKKLAPPFFWKLCHPRLILGTRSSTRGLHDLRKGVFRDDTDRHTHTHTHTDMPTYWPTRPSGPELVKNGVNNIMYIIPTRRYSTLRGPTSSSCGGLRPRLFLPLAIFGVQY